MHSVNVQTAIWNSTKHSVSQSGSYVQCAYCIVHPHRYIRMTPIRWRDSNLAHGKTSWR